MDKLIEFKHDNLKAEFESKLDNRLQLILYALAGFVYYKFGKSLVLTELCRTQAMQDEYYKDNKQYQIAKWQSVHQSEPCRGADISIKFFTQDELVDIAHFINSQLPYNANSTFQTLLIHDVNHGMHGHLQVNSFKESTIRKS